MLNNLFSFAAFAGWSDEGRHLLTCAVGVAVIVVAAALCRWIFARFVVPIVMRVVRKSSNKWDDYLLSPAMLRALAQIIPFLMMAAFLPLAFATLQGDYPTAITFVLRVVNALVAVYAVRLVLTFLTNISMVLSLGNGEGRHYVASILQFVKLIVVVAGVIVVVAILIGRSPLTFLAGLGAATTMLMLVFKDTILGLVAGIQLSVNGMLRVGDWISVKKEGIDGVVEKISLTTVKIRGWDNTILTIPPYNLTSGTFQNWRGMTESNGRLARRALYIDMGSICLCSDERLKYLREQHLVSEEDFTNARKPTNLTLYRRCVERKLGKDGNVNCEATLMLRQLQPTPNGLPIEAYFYVRNKEFVSYEHFVAEAMEQMIALLPEFGLKAYQLVVKTNDEP